MLSSKKVLKLIYNTSKFQYIKTQDDLWFGGYLGFVFLINMTYPLGFT